MQEWPHTNARGELGSAAPSDSCLPVTFPYCGGAACIGGQLAVTATICPLDTQGLCTSLFFIPGPSLLLLPNIQFMHPVKIPGTWTIRSGYGSLWPSNQWTKRRATCPRPTPTQWQWWSSRWWGPSIHQWGTGDAVATGPCWTPLHSWGKFLDQPWFCSLGGTSCPLFPWPLSPCTGRFFPFIFHGHILLISSSCEMKWLEGYLIIISFFKG